MLLDHFDNGKTVEMYPVINVVFSFILIFNKTLASSYYFKKIINSKAVINGVEKYYLLNTFITFCEKQFWNNEIVAARNKCNFCLCNMIPIAIESCV